MSRSDARPGSGKRARRRISRLVSESANSSSRPARMAASPCNRRTCMASTKRPVAASSSAAPTARTGGPEGGGRRAGPAATSDRILRHPVIAPRGAQDRDQVAERVKQDEERGADYDPQHFRGQCEADGLRDDRESGLQVKPTDRLVSELLHVLRRLRRNVTTRQRQRYRAREPGRYPSQAPDEADRLHACTALLRF